MRGAALALVVLAAALAAACRKPAPPEPPTPEEIGAELATFPQLLVPLSTDTAKGLKRAIELRGRLENVTRDDFEQSYEVVSVNEGGVSLAVMLAYAGAWLAPSGTLSQAMSVPQFFHAFEADAQAGVAVIVAPKGNIVITRDQIPRVRAKLVDAGVSDRQLPFSLVRGSR